MVIHPQVSHLNGIILVTLVAKFTGESTDETDRQRISSYGDPLINLGGTFVDGEFTFSTGAPEVWANLTTDMHKHPVRFMTQLPEGETSLGALDVLTANPVHAAETYVPTIGTRIALAMTQLRAKTPAKLVSLSDTTV